jgi:tetratricopeptide (TPR) repeat protein
MLGGYESALAALQSAREVLERRPTLPPRVNANVLYHLGGVLSTVPGCLESALQHLQEAYGITTRHGLIRDASGIALLLAHIYAKNGEIARALEIGREGLAISERVRGDAGHAWQCLSFAPVEMAAGNVHRALELARFGGRCGGEEPTRMAHAHTIEAEVLLRLGDATSALRLAAGATVTLHGQGQAPRLFSRAASVYAAATKRAGEGLARSIIGEIDYERDARELLDSLRR